MMEYSTVKSAILGEAQEASGQKKLKLLKAATTLWLSHREASKRIISRFETIVDALDSIINRNKDAADYRVPTEFLKKKFPEFSLRGQPNFPEF